jgi:rare lipoprotein A
MKSKVNTALRSAGYIPTTVFVLSLFIGCAAPSRFVAPPSQGRGGETSKQLLPEPITTFRQIGMASFYSPDLQNHITASGEAYDMNALTAAHPALPFNTLVRVTNLANNLSVVVRINDRGPYTKRRIIDISWAAAERIGLIESGTEKVEIEVVNPQEQQQPLQ